VSTTPTTWLDSFFVTIGVPVIVGAGSYIMQPGDVWLQIAAGCTVFLPGRPVVGQTLYLEATSGNFSTTNGTLNGNGRSVSDPQSQYTTASSVTLRTSAVTYKFRFDGALFRCVGMS
jgi:hypothetical protein